MPTDYPLHSDKPGMLTYQRALDTARTTEGQLDPHVADYLERAITLIWSQINKRPDSFILDPDQFAVFNFFIRRFEGSPVAEQAIDRYWRNTVKLPPLQC